MTNPPDATPEHNGPRKRPGEGPSGRPHPKARRKASAEDVPAHFAGVTPRQPYAGRGAFDRKRPEKPSANPRRVRGGVRLKHRADNPPTHWVCQRLLRFLETSVPGAAMVEGRSYAEVGQARSLTIEPGRVAASVQGRSEKPWSVEIGFETFDTDQVNAIVDAFATQALFSAKLLAGELPHAIEEYVQELGLRLVPTTPEELDARCTCGGPWATPAHMLETEENEGGDGTDAVIAEALREEAADGANGEATGEARARSAQPGPEADAQTADEVNPDGTWCKHIACTILLLIDRIAENPLLVFRLRGLHEDDLLSRMREQRALSGRGSESIPVYRSHVEGIESVPARDLEEVVAESPDGFWEMPHEADELELPVSEPEVRHPLLRRLGASPFTGAGFPLVGLLATCYDVMGEYVRDLDDEDAPEDDQPADAGPEHPGTDREPENAEPAAPEPPPAAPKAKAIPKAKPLGKAAKAKPLSR